MKEFDVRRAIGLDETLSASQKYTLIMLCTRLDWDTWTGQVSARDVAKVSSQTERQVFRHLAAIKRAGWIERLSELRADTPRLHHKANTRLNVELVKRILEGNPQTTPPAPVNTDTVKKDSTVKNVTTDINDSTVKSDTKEDTVKKDMSKTSVETCQKRQWGSVKSDSKAMTLSPYNNNNNQYTNQSIINREVKPELEVREAAETWDDAFSKHELEQITEEFRDGLWYVSRVDDMLEYRREVHRQCSHHNRRDVRDALLLAGGLLPQMARELIAPRSAIDWCTLQAAGELPSVPTPAAPPKPSQVITVTVQDQQRMKEVDQAWAVGSYDQRGNDEW